MCFHLNYLKLLGKVQLPSTTQHCPSHYQNSILRTYLLKTKNAGHSEKIKKNMVAKLEQISLISENHDKLQTRGK